MTTVELFCGTKSFSKIAASLGHKTFTVDNDPQHDPDICVNILALDPIELPYNPDILWASPPCESFSVAAIGHNWNLDRSPKSQRAFDGMRHVYRTLGVIQDIHPRWWFIENPRGMLRTLPMMKWYTRHTVSYCQYGDTRMKPTDIWTNASWWHPKPRCSPGASCHEAAPRGAKTGTQGIKGAVARGEIPPALFKEIFDQLPPLIRAEEEPATQGAFTWTSQPLHSSN